MVMAAPRRECASRTWRRSSATPGPKHFVSRKIRMLITGLNFSFIDSVYHHRAGRVKRGGVDESCRMCYSQWQRDHKESCPVMLFSEALEIRPRPDSRHGQRRQDLPRLPSGGRAFRRARHHRDLDAYAAGPCPAGASAPLRPARPPLWEHRAATANSARQAELGRGSVRSPTMCS